MTSLQIMNHTTSTIAVQCVPGFNGGLRQHFVMEVFETTENNTQVKIDKLTFTEMGKKRFRNCEDIRQGHQIGKHTGNEILSKGY